jgi:hypothetical protein
MSRETPGRGRPRRTSSARMVVALAMAGALALSGCEDEKDPKDDATAAVSGSPSPAADATADATNGGEDEAPEPTATPSVDEEESEEGSDEEPEDGSTETSYAVEPPAPFKGLSRADVLITATEPLPDGVIEKIRAVKGVETALPFSVGSASIDGRTLTIASVDPGAFRQFTPDVTARADFVWERVAGGELAVDTELDKKLIDKADMVTLGSDDDAPDVHVGAIAPLIRRSAGTPAEAPVFQVIVNEKRGEQIGIQEQNAILIDTGSYTPSALKDSFKKILGDRATMDTLALEFDTQGQTAVLTGQSVSEAVGTFTYTNGPDGTINPDQGWVKEFIRTETVPILGEVTCNKGALPQLRGALSDIVAAGLQSAIRVDQYAGCYYPRYIGRDSSNGLSLHSWGIAVDLNTATNQMGTTGDMNPGVVQIFKEWGFAWGGDWNYPDPMHFEMAKVVRPEGS